MSLMPDNVKIINLIAMQRAVERAVGSMGDDFVYNPNNMGYCAYVPLTDELAKDLRLSASELTPDSPKRLTGCIIGEALKSLGVRVDLMSAGKITAYVNDPGNNAIRMTDSALKFAFHVQNMQDAGFSWGAAYHAGSDMVNIMDLYEREREELEESNS